MEAQELYAQVDEHLEGLFGPPDADLEAASRRAVDAGLPSISVSPAIGRFLQVVALSCGARRILEVGTLAGYSTIWLARALPADGELVTLEYDPTHAEVARQNLAAAGLAEQVEVRVGAAIDTLRELTEEGGEPFDLVFIDADKAPYAEYLEASLQLAHPGTVIVADNVVRQGAVALGSSDDPSVTGVQRFAELAASDPRVTASFVQTVGAKGHDGLAVLVVR
ncbi:O-methyltransferase [Nitriliruptor alkaliphilus]|uniref:O-methyltransferase n=1 Tax=Nitriliruptor alkaliphilus TaxID=427918 RepID=UPI000697C4B9|nr:O-methyltransferase [Nitriliruptor alkaliphilus]